MKLSLALCLAALLSGWFGASAPQEPARPGFDHEHGLWSKVLAEFVVEGRVDYLELSKRTADLDRYAQELCTVEPSDFANWSKEQRLAFWLNAHNAFALQAMLLHYPLENLDSPAELPAAMPAIKSQQCRWTKGAAETARKNIGIRAYTAYGARNNSALPVISNSLKYVDSTAFSRIVCSNSASNL